jgi:hypothetical protein
LMVAALSLILSAQPLHVRADDGGDGGGGDGGSGDGSGTDSGTGTDSTGTDGAGNGGADDTGSDGPSNGDAAAPTAADDAPDAPSTDPSSVAQAVDQNDPTNVNNAQTPLDAIQAEATTDPRGGFIPTNPTDTVKLETGGTLPPGAAAPNAAVDVQIKAVIVSAAQSPWDAITKGPGVRNVIVTGGIIALGKTPIDGEIPGGGTQPLWLRLVPDLDLCSGKKIPPIVPNVIDIRTMNCPIEITSPDGEQKKW